MNCVIGNMQRI